MIAYIIVCDSDKAHSTQSLCLSLSLGLCVSPCLFLPQTTYLYRHYEGKFIRSLHIRRQCNRNSFHFDMQHTEREREYSLI